MARKYYLGIMAGVAVLGLSACASKPHTLKAPCGPTAGMTDPCGNRTPLNKDMRNLEQKAGETESERVVDL